MKNKIPIGCLSACLLFTGPFLGGCQQKLSSQPTQAASREGDSVLPFSFETQNGKILTNQDLEGQSWIANFIFTRCQGPCPVLTMHMRKLQQDFGSKNIRFVSFSVDPEFDTPDVLKSYGEKFGADFSSWHFLTGDKKTMYDYIRNSFHIGVGHDEGHEMSSEHIPHSLRFVLVNAEGTIRGTYNSNDDEAMEALRAQIKNF